MGVPVVLVRKKDGSLRFCVDYRQVNNVTQFDAYPLTRIDETLEALSGAKFFSTLDLISGYWQVGLTPQARLKISNRPIDVRKPFMIEGPKFLNILLATGFSFSTPN